MQPIKFDQATQIIVDRATEVLTRTRLSFEDQMAIENAVTAIAELRGWNRQRSAVVLHILAYPNQ